MEGLLKTSSTFSNILTTPYYVTREYKILCIFEKMDGIESSVPCLSFSS